MLGNRLGCRNQRVMFHANHLPSDHLGRRSVVLMAEGYPEPDNVLGVAYGTRRQIAYLISIMVRCYVYDRLPSSCSFRYRRLKEQEYLDDPTQLIDR